MIGIGSLSSKNSKRSIGTKMSLIVAATVFTCTMATALVFLVENFRQSVKAEEMRLQSVASIFCAVLSGPVADNNPVEARKALRALRDIPSLRQVIIHDANGVALAEMGSGAMLERTILRSTEISLSDMFRIETLQIKRPIIQSTKVVGTLTLSADISWLTKLFWSQVAIAFLFASLAIIAAILIARKFVKRATQRLTGLANELTDIGKNETLNYNFKRETNDEVGVLIDAFNDMMGRIEVRDRSLRHYSESLEDTVRERTVELVDARDEAERANAAKSEFLAMMSHEIRTPMNGMMVMAQMLAAAPLSPRHLRFAEIINRSGQNLLAIINDVLDISKIEAGKLILERSAFSIDELFADINGLFFERARERGLSIGYSIAPNVPKILLGDVTRLNQVITNLVNNALKFTETGGVMMHASAAKTKEGLCLSIRVSDTGIGIAKDKIDLVFERFVQADQTITRRYGGTGLGLAISQRLVEAMDGTIGVKSIEGKGSSFNVEVIIDNEPDDEKPANFSRKRIRLNIANPIAARSLADSLTSHGATICEGNETPDLVLTDNMADVQETATTIMYLVPALELHEASYRTRGRLELATPVSRESLQGLAEALRTNDFDGFRRLKRSKNVATSYNIYRGLRALAVDDNAVNRDVLNEALSAMGLEVDTATNGQEALDMAARQNYDIIFMDCSMPVMDGFAATRILRQREAGKSYRTPIVAITAFSKNSSDHDWRASGMDAWIAKPFTIPAIAERITALVLKSNAGGQQIEAPDNHIPDLSNVPLLDEQTVAMIARLGASETDAAPKRIINLFITNANIAVTGVREAAANADHSQVVELAHTLKSISESAGARQLSWVAGHIEAEAKAGRIVAASSFDTMDSIFAQTERELSARLGLGFGGNQARLAS